LEIDRKTLSDALLWRSVTHRGSALGWFVVGSGPPIVMIHGTGIGGIAWQPQLDALKHNFSCLCFDNRGLGRSQPVGEAINLEIMAEDVLAIMDAQGWHDAHLCGHSLGGLIALYAARLNPARVRSLSLLCTFASGAIPTRLTPWIIGMGIRSRLGTRQMRRNAMLAMVLPGACLRTGERNSWARRIADVFGREIEDQPAIVMTQLSAMRRADATPFLRELRDIPTLVVSAGHDRIALPHAGRALAASLPGSKFVEIADGAHAVTIQLADQVNALLLDHFQRVESLRGNTSHPMKNR
jgi:pimeloyl-ACP methyl ester carboxylesterase